MSFESQLTLALNTCAGRFSAEQQIHRQHLRSASRARNARFLPCARDGAFILRLCFILCIFSAYRVVVIYRTAPIVQVRWTFQNSLEAAKDTDARGHDLDASAFKGEQTNAQVLL